MLDDVLPIVSIFDVFGECVMFTWELFTPTGATGGAVLLREWLVLVVLVLPATSVLEVVSPPFTLLPPLTLLFAVDCIDTTVLFPLPA